MYANSGLALPLGPLEDRPNSDPNVVRGQRITCGAPLFPGRREAQRSGREAWKAAALPTELLPPGASLSGSARPAAAFRDAGNGTRALAGSLTLALLQHGSQLRIVLALVAILLVDDEIVERVIGAVPGDRPDLPPGLR